MQWLIILLKFLNHPYPTFELDQVGDLVNESTSQQRIQTHVKLDRII